MDMDTENLEQDCNATSDGHGGADGDKEDPELLHVKETLLKGCGCKSRQGEAINSYSSFDPQVIFSQRLSFREFEKSSKDLFLMSCLQAGALPADTTQQGTTCQRQRYQLSVSGVKVCIPVFIFLHEMSTKFYCTVRTHFERNVFVPREHGNKERKPHHALTFARSKNVFHFVLRCSEHYGIPQPTAARGRDGTPVFLPPSHTKKVVLQCMFGTARKQLQSQLDCQVLNPSGSSACQRYKW